MEREHRRASALASFSCDPAELESLLRTVARMFPPDREPSTRVEIKLANERVSYSTVDELMTVENLPATVTDVSARVLGVGPALEDSYNFLLECGLFGKPRAAANAPDPAWCASVLGVARDFASDHRTWHWFLRPWMMAILWIAVALLGVPYALEIVDDLVVGVHLWPMIVWVSLVAVFGYLALSFGTRFPGFCLVLRREEGFVRRYQTELMIAFAAVAAVASILGLFL